jgi:hypothetical protein
MPSRKKQQRRPKPQNRDAARTKWTGLETLPAGEGPESRRFYRIDTLASAVDGMLRGKDAFFTSTLKKLLGPADITAARFHLARDRKHEYVFRVEAGNARRKQITLALVVAKHQGDFSTLVKAEFDTMRKLRSRLGRNAPDLYRNGIIYLPERRSKKEGRELQAYLRQWVPGEGSPAVAAPDQLCVLTHPPRLLSRADTALIRAEMIRILVSAWHPARREGPDFADIGLDDFLIRFTGPGKPKLRLLSCRKTTRMNPGELAAAIARRTWRNEEGSFSLLPESPEDFYDILIKAQGRETAASILNAWREKKAGSGAPPEAWRGTLRELAG